MLFLGCSSFTLRQQCRTESEQERRRTDETTRDTRHPNMIWRNSRHTRKNSTKKSKNWNTSRLSMRNLHQDISRNTKKNQRTVFLLNQEMRQPGASWHTPQPGGCGCLLGRRWKWCSAGDASATATGREIRSVLSSSKATRNSSSSEWLMKTQCMT